MKVKKGLFRIYIVLSIMWASYIFLVIDVVSGLMFGFIPVPLYFVLKWISDGFK
jgi:hypothetical protein